MEVNSWQQINEMKNNLYLRAIRFYNIFVSAINEHKCKRVVNIRKGNAVHWIWISFSWYHGGGFLDSSWNVMAHGDAREGKWRGDWRVKWVASTLHTTSQYGVSSITTADAHTSAASSGLNWHPRRFKWNLPFLRKTKSGFCACANTFQLASTSLEKGHSLQTHSG